MSGDKFVEICCDLILKYYIEKLNFAEISKEKVYTVWLTKVLQNNKGLFSTTIPDGRYFEITYNGDKDEFYFDAYIKELNMAVKISEEK